MAGFLVTSRKTSANTSGWRGVSDLSGRMSLESKTEPEKGIFQFPTLVRLAPKRRWKIDAVTGDTMILRIITFSGLAETVSNYFFAAGIHQPADARFQVNNQPF